MPAPNPLALLRTVFSWVRAPRAFLKALASRPEVPLPRPGRLVCFSFLSLFLGLVLVDFVQRILIVIVLRHRRGSLGLRSFLSDSLFQARSTFLSPESVVLRALPETVAFLCACVVAAVLFSLVNAKQRAVIRGWSGLCVLSIMLLPAVLFVNAAASWTLAIRLGLAKSSLFGPLVNYSLPVYGAVLVAVIERIVGKAGLRKTLAILLPAAGVFYVCYDCVLVTLAGILARLFLSLSG